ncbi:MAG: penicillin-binding protein [Anaerolineae bacterium]
MMSGSTRIIRGRQRRKRREQQNGRLPLRLLGLAALVSLASAFIFLLGGVTGTSTIYAYFTRAMPEFEAVKRSIPGNAASPEPTIIYAVDNQRALNPAPIYEINDPLQGNGRWAPLAEIPQALQDATVAFIDPGFWHSQDFGEGSLSYVLLELFDQEQSRTPATITQQVVHNYLTAARRKALHDQPESGRVPDRLEELFLTHRVYNSFTREQVLEWYLNTAPYGNLAFGAEAAARVYFDKPIADITLAEAAMLAAIPPSPDANPIDDPAAAQLRQQQVLEAMAREGYISPEDVAAARFDPIRIAPGIEQRFDIIAPHFALYVRRELETILGPDLLLSGGLRVYTSLDLEMQQQAACVARAHIARLSGRLGAELPADERASCAALAFLPPLPAAEQGIGHQVSNAAVVVLDSETAAIRVMVGSLNYWDESINGSLNMAANGRRQPGTALIPFTYLTALSQGYTAATMVLDVKTDFGAAAGGSSYVPQNRDGQFHGPMHLRQALGSGYHVPAIQVMTWVGVDKVLRIARSLGLTRLGEATKQYGLSLTLGGGEVNLLDMVYAYNVMNNMGVMLGRPRPEMQPDFRTLDPVAVLRVEDSEGRVLYEYAQAERRKILTPQLAYLMNDMLSDRSARCPAFGCPNVMELPGNRPAAVKTGSTNDFRDAWTIGYTPQLAAGVWVGNSDQAVMDGVTGFTGAAPIWHAFMSWAMQGEEVALWVRPPDLVEMAVCQISGLLPTPFCPTVSELFITGTEPAVPDNIFREYTINRETGRLATVYTPADLVEKRIYQVYPEPAAQWAREHGIEPPPTEFDTINVARTRVDGAAIQTPQPFAYVSGSVTILGTAAGGDFSHYRLAYFEGLTPSNLKTIADQVTKPVENETLGVWNVENLSGLYTLLLTVVHEDGSFAEVSLPVTVDNVPPTVSILFPRPNQAISGGREQLTIHVSARDDVALDRVEFYADAAMTPFAVSRSLPFSVQWDITDKECHTFQARAVDAAGNKAASALVPVCFID